ncbi:hypothetical protein HMPREF3189_01163 [Clostridiales bacterium KA00134]|nr:hypothetical protein HMPREF3189_01163 [Clostridiales bacterium KA00134]
MPYKLLFILYCYDSICDYWLLFKLSSTFSIPNMTYNFLKFLAFKKALKRRF